jgi:hypothetical protein
MMKRIVRRVLWLGKGTATMMGLALMLAVVFGVATTAMAAVPGDPFRLGRLNTIDKISQLVGSVDNAMLRIDNNNSGDNATALDLQVEPDNPPMRVNSVEKVVNLNADGLDGIDSTSFMKNFPIIKESVLGPGIQQGDGTFKIDVSCVPGDRMLSGGPANIDSTSTVLESFPGSVNTWSVRINKNGKADDFSAVALCIVQ